MFFTGLLPESWYAGNEQIVGINWAWFDAQVVAVGQVSCIRFAADASQEESVQPRPMIGE